MVRRILNFFGNILRGMFHFVTGFVVSIVTNIEAVIILSLASIGAAAILAELPFIIAVPLWLESTLIVPVIATSAVLMLAWVLELRMQACVA